MNKAQRSKSKKTETIQQENLKSRKPRLYRKDVLNQEIKIEQVYSLKQEIFNLKTKTCASK